MKYKRELKSILIGLPFLALWIVFGFWSMAWCVLGLVGGWVGNALGVAPELDMRVRGWVARRGAALHRWARGET